LETGYNVAWRQAVKSLKKIGQLASEYGVCFVIEFACRKNAELVNTMDDALRMLDEVGYENVLVMADTFHIYEENDSLRETVLKAGKRLGYVHISDNDRFMPGKGQINLKEFVKALKEINYDGYLTMEFDAGSSPNESLRQASKYLLNFL
jgi:sugar phosphate isomerase/epimerase